MRAIKTLGLAVLVASLGLAGCATYDSAVPASTGIGAGAGALLGYGLTGSGLGAAAGAGAGALAGAITGTVVDETRRQRVQPPPPYGYQEQYQPAPPYGYQEQYQPAPQAYATQPDPTRGELFNNTRWRIEVYVDDVKEPLFLNSRRNYPLSLDTGSHRIVANAYVATQFGERPVGSYEQTIYVDPRSSGWSLRFDETMF